ncbi:hypothetical protein [Stenotrophomonas sp. 3(2025)]|uniref:hypothetical protein n=1 Tax=Stenotrophomonas sp. 3(2025) TaxID=3456023 RepID=UPI004044B9AC
MRFRTVLAVTSSLLMAGCSLSEPPPRSGSPGAAVSQLQDVQACSTAFSLPAGWRVQPLGEERWMLHGTGARPLQVTLQCQTFSLDGPADPVLEPVLGPLDTAAMNAKRIYWGTPTEPRHQAVAIERRWMEGSEVQEAVELPRMVEDPAGAPHALLMLRWDEADASHIQQREALIASLTQSLEASGAAKNTTGTAP